MAQDHIIEWIGTVLLFFFGITMICQGHAIFHGKYGYKHSEREKHRSADIRKQLEEIINANGHSTEED
jgi:putative Mn2+ efflux pump MntP